MLNTIVTDAKTASTSHSTNSEYSLFFFNSASFVLSKLLIFSHPQSTIMKPLFISQTNTLGKGLELGKVKI